MSGVGWSLPWPDVETLAGFETLADLETMASQGLALLAQQLLYASCVALLVALPAHWLGKRYPALAHGLWSLVWIRLMMPPNGASSFSLRAMVEGWLAHRAPAFPLHGTSIPPALSMLPTAASLSASDPSSSGLPTGLLLLLLWGLAGLLLFWLAGRRRRSYERLLQTRLLAPDLLRRLEHWQQRLDLSTPVSLWTGTSEQAPFTLGIRRPRIFLPQRLLRRLHGDDSEGRDLLDAVLGHELAHIAHRDDLWLRCQRFLLSLYPFFPPLWLACRRMHDARERMADACALTAGDLSPRRYALALLRVHQMQLNRPTAVSAFGPNPRRLVVRIRSILDLPVAPQRATTGSLGAAWRRRLTRPVAALPLVVLLSLLVLPMAAPRANADGNSSAGGGEPPSTGSKGEPKGSQAPPSAVTVQLDGPTTVLQNPLAKGRLTASFGPWKSPFQDGHPHHNGLDLASAEGSAIIAPAAGTVRRVQRQDLDDYGVVLIIDHGDGLETFYAHLGEVVVEEGDRVQSGQTIATVGMSGKTTGPHLHFEVRRAGQPVDPAAWIDDFC